jgi:hypothetical protein
MAARALSVRSCRRPLALPSSSPSGRYLPAWSGPSPRTADVLDPGNLDATSRYVVLRIISGPIQNERLQFHLPGPRGVTTLYSSASQKRSDTR